MNGPELLRRFATLRDELDTMVNELGGNLTREEGSSSWPAGSVRQRAEFAHDRLDSVCLNVGQQGDKLQALDQRTGVAFTKILARVEALEDVLRTVEQRTGNVGFAALLARVETLENLRESDAMVVREVEQRTFKRKPR